MRALAWKQVRSVKVCLLVPRQSCLYINCAYLFDGAVDAVAKYLSVVLFRATCLASLFLLSEVQQ